MIAAHRLSVHISTARSSRRRAMISQQLLAQPEPAPSAELSRCRRVLPVALDGLPELRHPLGRRAHSRHDRHPPAVVGTLTRLARQLKSSAPRFRRVLLHPGPVGLVDDEDVGDLHPVRPCSCTASAPARVHDHHGRVGLSPNSTSTCPTPTVSTRIQRCPSTSSRRIASGVASDRPPRCPAWPSTG